MKKKINNFSKNVDIVAKDNIIYCNLIYNTRIPPDNSNINITIVTSIPY